MVLGALLRYDSPRPTSIVAREKLKVQDNSHNDLNIIPESVYEVYDLELYSDIGVVRTFSLKR